MTLKVMLVERKEKKRSQISYVIVQCICFKSILGMLYEVVRADKKKKKLLHVLNVLKSVSCKKM